jgi:hypothetical protein
MKARLLVTTAALALAVATGGPVAAQSRYGDNAQSDHTAVQKKEPRKSTDANSDVKRHETTGQASPDEKRGPQTGDDKAQAAPARAGQANGDGNAANGKQGAANPRATAQDRRSGEMKDPDEAKEKSGDKGNEHSAQTPAGHNGRQQAQTPRSDNKSRSSGSTAGESHERSAQTPGARSPGDNARGQASGERSGSQADAHRANGQARPAERLSASLKAPQKTRLTEVFEKTKVQPVTHVDFSVAVGTEVPRTVVLHPVPETIVNIIPEYRDYDFFVVREEIVIVEPRTHKIVDVIERHGNSRAEVTTKANHKTKLSAKDRHYLVQHLSRERTTVTTGTAPRESRIIVGEDAPEAVEIDSFPDEVYREVPAVRSYRYIHSGNNVYLVEPNSRRVIEQIDEDSD